MVASIVFDSSERKLHQHYKMNIIYLSRAISCIESCLLKPSSLFWKASILSFFQALFKAWWKLRILLCGPSVTFSFWTTDNSSSATSLHTPARLPKAFSSRDRIVVEDTEVDWADALSLSPSRLSSRQIVSRSTFFWDDPVAEWYISWPSDISLLPKSTNWATLAARLKAENGSIRLEKDSSGTRCLRGRLSLSD